MTTTKLRRSKKITPRDPFDIDGKEAHELMISLGLRAVRYGRLQTRDRKWWLPLDLIGEDGKSLIIYRLRDADYSIDGWEPWHDGMFGGRYESILSALGWIRRAKEIRAGTARNF